MMLEGKVAAVTGPEEESAGKSPSFWPMKGPRWLVNDFGGREDGTGGESR